MSKTISFRMIVRRREKSRRRIVTGTIISDTCVVFVRLDGARIRNITLRKASMLGLRFEINIVQEENPVETMAYVNFWKLVNKPQLCKFSIFLCVTQTRKKKCFAIMSENIFQKAIISKMFSFQMFTIRVERDNFRVALCTILAIIVDEYTAAVRAADVLTHNCSIVISCFSRVHVTRATMEQLNGRFAVEPGNGGTREGYLADHKVETFLIVHPSDANVSIAVSIGVGKGWVLGI